jgi:hypothetical protein
MKTGTLVRTFVLASLLAGALAVGLSAGIAADRDDGQTADSPPPQQGKTADDDGRDHSLVGVWEETAPAEVDCETGVPFGPTIKALLTFNQGGTMYVEDTFPASGPYRSTGGGVWTRNSGRDYSYANLHYEFDPDRTFLYTIKQRSNLRLSKDGSSFTERGVFQGLDFDGNEIFRGCFAATATRPQF